MLAVIEILLLIFYIIFIQQCHYLFNDSVYYDFIMSNHFKK